MDRSPVAAGKESTMRACGKGLVLLGAVLGLQFGCDDDERKVRYHEVDVEREPRQVDVDVHVGRAEPVVVERPPVVVERRPVVVERQPVIVEQPPVVVERRPVIVERRPVVVVREAPPAVLVERRPPPPAHASIWIEGHWQYSGKKYVWAKGRYERSRAGQHYVQPRWVKTDKGFGFHAGYWERD
jgi:hypothetical protein